MQKKWMKRVAAGLACCMLVSSPAMAGAKATADDREAMPLAIIGSVIGGVTWVVSLPFCALLTPASMLDGFDPMVVEPMRKAVGVSAKH